MHLHLAEALYKHIYTHNPWMDFEIAVLSNYIEKRRHDGSACTRKKIISKKKNLSPCSGVKAPSRNGVQPTGAKHVFDEYSAP